MAFTLLDRQLDPVFWPAARPGVESAWVSHIPFAYWLVNTHRPSRVVELGTHSGVSYTAFCEAVLRCGLSCECIAIDTWRGDHQSGLYEDVVFTELNRFNEARYKHFSTLRRSTFDEGLQFVADDSIDLLHIDGLHTFEAVSHDFRSWLPKLSHKAVVLFHDTAVTEPGFGVKTLFANLQKLYPSFEFKHGSGLGMLLIGDHLSNDIRSLASLNEQAADLFRQRFEFLGARWHAIMECELLAAKLTQNFVNIQ